MTKKKRHQRPRKNKPVVYLDGEDGQTIEFTKDQAIAKLWSLGILSWKLHKAQLDIYESFHRSSGQKYVVECSRRLGKSYCLCLMAIEFALQNPHAIICYAAPTAKAVKKIITPQMTKILQDCPAYLRPKWKVGESVYTFPNGSEIHVAGTDAERAEALRGRSMHLGICDEAGFMDQLDYVVSDILMPQTLDTGGRIILASTPAKIPGHDFVDMAEEAEMSGNYTRKTIYDNPRLDKATIIKAMMETDKTLSKKQADIFYKNKGGPDNATWRREYMAERLTDPDRAILPEFTDDVSRELTQIVTRPQFYDAYVGMDVGFKDFTVVLFGYWDFFNARLIIEDEIVLHKMTTLTLAEGIKQTELKLWQHKKPYMRYSDTDLIVINDLNKLHGIIFSPTPKDNKEAAINLLRILIVEKKLIIHPRCEILKMHMRYGVWNKGKTKFDTSRKHGHYDALDALIYLTRNVNRGKNPVPKGHGQNIYEQFLSPDLNKNTNEEVLKKAFGIIKLRDRFDFTK